MGKMPPQFMKKFAKPAFGRQPSAAPPAADPAAMEDTMASAPTMPRQPPSHQPGLHATAGARINALQAKAKALRG